MIIRSFVADSVAAALKEVRSQMGGDAVVLKTREVSLPGGGHQFEVTACLDQPSAAQASTALADPGTVAPRLQTAAAPAEAPVVPEEPQSRLEQAALRPEPPATAAPDLMHRLAAIESKIDDLTRRDLVTAAGISARLEPVYDSIRALQQADVPTDWLTDFCAELTANLETADLTESTVRAALTARLTSLIDPEVLFEAGDRVLVIGPAGAGKTSVLGKLASSLVMEQKTPVKLMSLDSYKVGALDEIESYGDLLGIEVDDPITLSDPTHAVNNPETNKTVTLIDTGSLPSDETRRRIQLKDYQKARATHRLLVVPATMRSSDVRRFAAQVSDVSPTHVVVSQTDLTSCWGALIAAAEAAGAKLMLISNSPSGTGKLQTPDADLIASRLLLGEDHDD